MRKQWKIFCISFLAVCLLAGCGGAGNPELPEAQEKTWAARETAESAAGLKADQEANGDAREAEAGQELILNERETEDGEVQGISIRIYHSDDSAENICVNTALTGEITPEILLMNLASYGMLPDTVKAECFEKSTQDGDKAADTRLTLDLSADFGTYLNSMGTAGETMVMGSLVNTFLDAYEASAMKVTVDGQTLETGHQVYDEWLEMYPYLEASYSVTDGLIEAGGGIFYYPQIQNAADTELQDQWNTQMREKAESMAEGLEEGLSLWGRYEVKTMNDELLSIWVTGEIMSPGAAYPNRFQYTYNIDMKTGENIRLAHYMDVEQIAENLMNGEDCTVTGELASEFQERLTVLYGDASQLAAALKGFDFGKGQAEHPAGYSYQEDGHTCLCIEVPHALGDFVNVVLE